MSEQAGVLYLVATPVGNLEDITYRALRILKEVDFIAAEDTRHSLKLLNHFEISKPMISYYEHNIRERGEQIIKRLKDGQNAALVTDAGTPAISDPGEDIVRLCVEEHIRVVPIPGAVAAINALICSSLPTSRFSFEGFLSVNKKSRIDHLSSVKFSRYTLIFYEAPHKLLNTLCDMLEYFGDRKITVARELTKKYEEFLYTTISGAISHFKDVPPKGEFVLVVEGAKDAKETTVFDNMSVLEHINYYMQAGLDKKEAMKKVAQDRGVSKREIYAETIKN
jgi:16S rRNA (cytidine1402-2'-O)-methyltransferase